MKHVSYLNNKIVYLTFFSIFFFFYNIPAEFVFISRKLNT